MKEENDLIKKGAAICGIDTEKYLKIMKEKEIGYDCYFVDSIDVDREMKKSSNALRLMTGIPELDNLTKGLSAGIHVISGFRKCCKSTFSINLIYRALNEGKNVCLLSLEMSKIDVLNILLSLHSFECNPEKAVTRDELLTLYELDRNSYDEILHSFLSLPGCLVIYTEKDLEKDTNGNPIYSEENLNSKFTEINEATYKKTKMPIQVLVVDNINCIRKWDKRTTGELAYTLASNYFKNVALDFGEVIYDEESRVSYGGTPVVLLLLAQINRSGGKEALYNGFYSESSIAETVNIERDATTIIPIFASSESIAHGRAFIKLEATRYCQSMDNPVTIPVNLRYGKIGYPLEYINIDDKKLEDVKIKSNLKLVEFDENYETYRILMPNDKKLPENFREVNPDMKE